MEQGSDADQKGGLAAKAALYGQRGVAWISNAVERRLRAEHFVVANRTPYHVIHRNGLLTVRRYPPLDVDEIEVGDEPMPVNHTRHRVPVLLVPPLAADPLNFDLMPNRSLVRYLLACGFRVYLVDFGSPDATTRRLSLADYTTRMLPEAIEQVRADAGESELSLYGYCMGGLFCLVYEGWSHDPDIRNIVTIASPVDSHQIGVAGRLITAMNGPVRLVRRFTPFRIHNLDPEHLRIPGWAASAAFKMTNPLGVVQGYLDLLMNLWDRDYVTRYQTMAQWFNKMHDYPGGIVQDFVVRVGLDNELASGRIKLGEDQQALLDRIDCSMLAIAGSGDKIVTVDSARKVLDIVASKDKMFRVAPGGHAGVFAGSRAASTSWAWAADWLGSRSDAARPRAPARKAVRKRALGDGAAAKPRVKRPRIARKTTTRVDTGSPTSGEDA